MSETSTDDVSVKRGKRWSREEDDLLRQLVHEYGEDKWMEVIEGFQKEFPDRRKSGIRLRWSDHLNGECTQTLWSDEEKDLLNRLTEAHGHVSWSKIVDEFQLAFPGKRKKTIHRYWYTHLRDDVSTKDWTKEEEHFLIEAQKKHGNKWAKIKELFPARNEYQLQRQFLKITGGRGQLNATVSRSYWTAEKDDDRLKQFLSSGAMGDVRPSERLDSFFQESPPHYQIHVPQIPKTQFFEEGDMGSVGDMGSMGAAGVPPPSSRSVNAGVRVPGKTSKAWTHEEDDLFIQELKDHGQNWVKISTKFPYRSFRSVKDHGLILLKRNPISGTMPDVKGRREHDAKEADETEFARTCWGPEEDSLLKQIVEQHVCKVKVSRCDCWNETTAAFQKHFPARSKRSCMHRWKRLGKPGSDDFRSNRKGGIWTKEEDNLLLKEQTEQGSNWKRIGKKFPNRSISALQCRWVLITKEEERKNQIREQNETLDSFEDAETFSDNPTNLSVEHQDGHADKADWVEWVPAADEAPPFKSATDDPLETVLDSHAAPESPGFISLRAILADAEHGLLSVDDDRLDLSNTLPGLEDYETLGLD